MAAGGRPRPARAAVLVPDPRSRDRQGDRRAGHLLSVPGALPAGDGGCRDRSGRRRWDVPDRSRLLAGESAHSGRRRHRRAGRAGAPRRCRGRDPTLPGGCHHGTRRHLGCSGAAARRSPRRGGAHADGVSRHAGLLRTAAQRRRPANRRRRQRYTRGRGRLSGGRAPRTPLRPRLRLLRSMQRQQGLGHPVRIRERCQRAARTGGEAAPALWRRRDPVRGSKLPRGARRQTTRS